MDEELNQAWANFFKLVQPILDVKPTADPRQEELTRINHVLGTLISEGNLNVRQVEALAELINASYAAGQKDTHHMDKNKVTKAMDIEGKAERRLEVGTIVKMIDGSANQYEGTFTVTEPHCLTQLPDHDGFSLVSVVEPNDLEGFIDHFTVLGKQPCLDKDGNEIDLRTITGFDISIEPHKLEIVVPKDI